MEITLGSFFTCGNLLDVNGFRKSGKTLHLLQCEQL